MATMLTVEACAGEMKLSGNACRLLPVDKLALDFFSMRMLADAALPRMAFLVQLPPSGSGANGKRFSEAWRVSLALTSMGMLSE
jgi:hypothetical protein